MKRPALGSGGYYKDVRPLATAVRRVLATVPVVDNTQRSELGLDATEASNALLAERIMQPALNVRSHQSSLSRCRRGALQSERERQCLRKPAAIDV